jgi:hypothetical protein
MSKEQIQDKVATFLKDIVPTNTTISEFMRIVLLTTDTIHKEINKNNN